MSPDPETASKISRLVAWILGPLIVIASAFIANWAQVLFNANLDGIELTAFLSSVILPVGGLIATWLYNRGKYEIEAVKAENPALAPVISEVVERSVEQALERAGYSPGPEPQGQPPIGTGT